MYIYEAGCLTYNYKNNIFDLSTDWRNKIDNWAYDNNVNTFNPALTFYSEKAHSYCSNAYVIQNNYYMNKADIMILDLVNLHESPGTIYEIVAFAKMGKPIIAFGECKWDWSPHINSCITQKLDTIEDVIEMLVIMFNQNNF